jgi:hypothetical protein
MLLHTSAPETDAHNPIRGTVVHTRLDTACARKRESEHALCAERASVGLACPRLPMEIGENETGRWRRRFDWLDAGSRRGLGGRKNLRNVGHLDNGNASALGETPFPLHDIGHDTLRLVGIFVNAILGMAIQYEVIGEAMRYSFSNGAVYSLLSSELRLRRRSSPC